MQFLPLACNYFSTLIMSQNSIFQNNLLPAALFIMIGAVFLVALMDIVAKLLSVNLPLGQIVWGRFFFHTLLMMPLCLWKTKKNTAVLTQNWKEHLLRGALILLSTIFYFAAIKENPIPDTIAMFFVEPIFVMFLAAFFLKEKLRIQRLLAAFIAFCGVLIVLRPGSGQYQPSILFAFCAGLAFAGYIVTVRLSAFRTSSFITAWTTASAALIFSTPWGLFVWQTPTLQEWFLLLLLGALAASGHWAIVYACRLADASIVALFHYSEIIVTSILSYLVFAYLPDRWVWIGFLLIAGSQIVVTVLEMKKNSLITREIKE